VSGGPRMSLADLAQTRAWADPRNRQRLAEAAGGVRPVKRGVDFVPESEASEAAGLPPAIHEQPTSLQQDCRQPPAAPDFRPLLLACTPELLPIPRDLAGEALLQAGLVLHVRVGVHNGLWNLSVRDNYLNIPVRVPSEKECAGSPALIRLRQKKLAEAKRAGARRKAAGMMPGWPDLTLEGPDLARAGGTAHAEVKLPGEGPSPEQRACIAWLRSWGRAVEIVHDWNELLAFMAACGVPGAMP
jgi:hypothetical protein